MRRSKCIKNSPQRYNPGFGAAREWKDDDAVSIVYMIQYRDINSNVGMDDILLLLDEWDAEDCMNMQINVSYERILCSQYSKP